jgi:hypothetical protein
LWHFRPSADSAGSAKSFSAPRFHDVIAPSGPRENAAVLVLSTIFSADIVASDPLGCARLGADVSEIRFLDLHTQGMCQSGALKRVQPNRSWVQGTHEPGQFDTLDLHAPQMGTDFIAIAIPSNEKT